MKGRQLLGLIEVGDKVTVEIEGLQLREVQELVFDTFKMVVGKVQPLNVSGAPHNLVEHGGEAHDTSKLVVLQKDGSGLSLNDHLLGSSYFSVLILSSHLLVSVLGQTDGVGEDLVDFLGLRSLNNGLLLNLLLGLFLVAFDGRWNHGVVLLSVVFIFRLRDGSPARRITTALFLSQLLNIRYLKVGEVQRLVVTFSPEAQVLLLILATY